MSREMSSPSPVQTLPRAERRRQVREAGKSRPEEMRRVLEQEGLGALAHEMGLAALHDLMEEDANRACGVEKKWQQGAKGRVGYRNGRAKDGEVRLGGLKVKIQRPRVIRLKELGGGELELASYEAAQNPEFASNSVLMSTVFGVSTRNYAKVTGAAMAPGDGIDCRGPSKSEVNRRFIERSERFLEKFLSRRLDQRYLVVWLDALHKKGYSVLAAVGLTETGEKEVLGLRQGSTESAELCAEFLEDLVARGLSAERGLLFVIDGGKGLSKALREVFGAHVRVQRCRIHKKRNVLDKITLREGYRLIVERELEAAWKTANPGLARAKMELVARGLEARGQHKAAASVREGMREMLTCCELGVPVELYVSLTNTNVIESAFSQYEATAHRVKRWHDGRHLLRWASVALYRAECSFTKLGKPALLEQLARALERDAAKHRGGKAAEQPALAS